MSLIQSLESQHQHPFGSAATPSSQKEHQIPSAHQTGVQGRAAESTANRSNAPPHPPQCFKKGSALLSQISLGINFLFKGHDGDALPHTHQEILLVCNIFCNIVSHFVCVRVCWVGGLCLSSPLPMCGFFFPSSSPTDSSECFIMSSLWTVDEGSAVLFSLFTHRHTFCHHSWISDFCALINVCGLCERSQLHFSSSSWQSECQHTKAFYYRTTGHLPHSTAASMMKDCLQFLIEPAKKLKIRLKVWV